MRLSILIIVVLALGTSVAFAQDPPAVPPPVTPQAAEPAGVAPAVVETPVPAESIPAVEPSPSATPSPKPTVTDYKKFRDPFFEIKPLIKDNEKKTDLELYGTTEFKLTGVSTGPYRMRAILVSPKGKSFIVNEGTKIGQRNGVIKKITTRSVVISEELVNELGEVEKSELEIALDAEGAK